MEEARMVQSCEGMNGKSSTEGNATNSAASCSPAAACVGGLLLMFFGGTLGWLAGAHFKQQECSEHIRRLQNWTDKDTKQTSARDRKEDDPADLDRLRGWLSSEKYGYSVSSVLSVKRDGPANDYAKVFVAVSLRKGERTDRIVRVEMLRLSHEGRVTWVLEGVYGTNLRE
jgi:hypothetical protein